MDCRNVNTMEVIILAGGFGTRLREEIKDIPKPMAPIQGRPFLDYLLTQISTYQVSKFILCTGFKHEIIENYFGRIFNNIPICYSAEKEPLGTGGAVKQALSLISADSCLIVNGDTFFNIDLGALWKYHIEKASDFTIALKQLSDFDRYGTIQKQGDKIIAFEEKHYCKTGEINGGIYVIRKDIFNKYSLEKTFSLEKDFLEKYVSELNIYGKIFYDYFIDIGVPTDYRKAQQSLKSMIKI
jgi:D-glycero-alpha-D-manno-heptose 1-phosphate guanylyltransferase